MKKVFLFILGGTLLFACNQPPKPDVTETATKPQPVELADLKYAGVCKENLKSLAEGSIDNFVSAFADNVRFTWNNGDSIVGKQAVRDYWVARRSKVIDTITYAPDIWLGIKSNESPAPGIATGTWVFGWFNTTITYSNGKKVTEWIHQVYHFDGADKIDYISQYVDRAPINAALAAK